MLELLDLRMRRGTTQALDGVSLQVAPGEILGLLGPNGAGKSTLVSITSGLLEPDSGSVELRVSTTLAGSPRDPRIRRHIGLAPQSLAVYAELSGAENLAFFAGLGGVARAEIPARVEAALAFVGLGDRASDRVKTYSGGMARRLNLAAALVHQPALLLLDEPTVGVDPQSRDHLLANVEQLRAQGKAVLYTTHYMEEAQELCDELAIVDRGRRVAHGSLDALRRQIDDRDLLTLRGDFPVDATRPVLARRGADATVHEAEDRLVLSLPDASSLLAGLLGELSAAGAVVREVSLARPNLESLFLRLTGRQLRQ